MKTSQFDYQLPEELIAQSPAIPRESCRLLVVKKDTGVLEHRVFSDILEYLNPDDLLVVNDTKVMPARLLGVKEGLTTPAEVLLLHRCPSYDKESDLYEQHWKALVKPGRRLKPGATIRFEHLDAEVVDWVDKDGKGQRILRLKTSAPTTVSEAIQKQGELPLPPYIKEYKADTSWYQTVYAQEQNSAAAPTAGLHFSEDLLERALAKGCSLARVCLEIGLDTFRKVEEENIADHQIHSEVYTVSQETVKAVEQTKKRGGRVIAVGTTAVRALESAAERVNHDAVGSEPLSAWDNALDEQKALLSTVKREQTQLYITPGYQFRVVDALITNFHTPRSTLLMLVSAFAGHDTIFKAYDEALKQNYRFLSFGDAMFIE